MRNPSPPCSQPRAGQRCSACACPRPRTCSPCRTQGTASRCGGCPGHRPRHPGRGTKVRNLNKSSMRPSDAVTFEAIQPLRMKHKCLMRRLGPLKPFQFCFFSGKKVLAKRLFTRLTSLTPCSLQTRPLSCGKTKTLRTITK